MKISELKKIVDGAVMYFDEDHEVVIYDEDGEPFEPFDLKLIVAQGTVRFVE